MQSNPIVIIVPGTPASQPRPRRSKTGQFVSTTTKIGKAWRKAVEAAVWDTVLRYGGFGDTPVALTIGIAISRPKAHYLQPYQKHGNGLIMPPGDRGMLELDAPWLPKNDWDNLGKLISDVAEQSGLFCNDNLVGDAHVLKRFVHWWERGFAVIVCRPLTGLIHETEAGMVRACVSLSKHDSQNHEGGIAPPG